MKSRQIHFWFTKDLYVFLLIGSLLAFIGACSGNFGRIQRDDQVYQNFVNYEFDPSYKYYYYGHTMIPYAIVGIDPQYNLQSDFWNEIDQDSEEIQRKVRAVWQDYGFYEYGAYLYDPQGNRFGVLYTSIYGVSVKVDEEKNVAILLNRPYLWGPDDPGGGGGGIGIRIR